MIVEQSPIDTLLRRDENTDWILLNVDSVASILATSIALRKHVLHGITTFDDQNDILLYDTISMCES